MPRMGGGRMRSPSRNSSRTRSPPPPPPKNTPQHPSMAKQMAATAGGVVAGSMIANALFGGRRESDDSRSDYREEEDPCRKEVKNLLECLSMAQETNSELKICASFEKALLECRKLHGTRN